MKTFVIDEFSVSENKACNFYTVRFDDEEVSETDKFIDRFNAEDNEYYEDLQMIGALIEVLSEDGTAVIRRARDESRAFALPPEVLEASAKINVTGNKLRLYYVELSERVFVLLGGGVAHGEPYGHPPIQLKDAQIFAKKIEEAVGTEFDIDNNMLIPIVGSEIIIH